MLCVYTPLCIYNALCAYTPLCIYSYYGTSHVFFWTFCLYVYYSRRYLREVTKSHSSLYVNCLLISGSQMEMKNV